jgi:hypothetical protein
MVFRIWPLGTHVVCRLPPCVKKVARRSRGQRKLLLGHELMRWTPVPFFGKFGTGVRGVGASRNQLN